MGQKLFWLILSAHHITNIQTMNPVSRDILILKIKVKVNHFVLQRSLETAVR